MGTLITTLVFLLYLVLLFAVAAVAERSTGKWQRVFKSPLVYALSLTVYCTAWTLLGSVGQAANYGLSFLPIYLGPLMLAPIWPFLVKKMILICKAERITSLPDFLSSRYGKSRSLGAVAAVFLVIGTIPYISIQLKAIATIFDLLAGVNSVETEKAFYQDSALLLTLVLTLFTVIYGARKLDANERHVGVIAAISFEAIFKLLCFLAVGVVVVFYFFGGPLEFFERVSAAPEVHHLWSFISSGISGWDWFWLNLISMCAVILLPRQFHVTIVENDDVTYTEKAAWLFPLYLLLINLFVIPIAAAGILHFGEAGLSVADSFVISLPTALGYKSLALLAGLGGFAAATGMVIISSIALSLMISNNLVLPYLFDYGSSVSKSGADLAKPLLQIRRLIIIAVLIMAYGYYLGVASRYPLVAIGLISFAAVAQFAPSVIAGLYWKEATRKGALYGIIAGFAVWAYTLALPFSQISFLPTTSWIAQGPFGIEWLRPHVLLGAEGMSPVAHGVFWSLTANVVGLVLGSLFSKPTTIEITQADFFVDHLKHRKNQPFYTTRQRSALTADLDQLLSRFIGPKRARQLINQFYLQHQLGKRGPNDKASTELINFVEQQLAGSIGTASAQILVRSISKETPIKLQEVITILQRTQDALQYNKALEVKQVELEELAQRLKTANAQLTHLDRLKAEFISTVTHELRTPITSIKSLARILLDSPEISTEKKATFLRIIVSESERLARLVSQVLDLEKIERQLDNEQAEWNELNTVIASAVASLSPLAEEKGVKLTTKLASRSCFVRLQQDRLTQVIVNLVGNAIKFTPQQNGIVSITINLSKKGDLVEIRIRDNGPGIPHEKQQFVFERFTQISSQKTGKPSGSGLGLHITKTIIEQANGTLRIEPNYTEGAGFIVQLPQWSANPSATLTFPLSTNYLI